MSKPTLVVVALWAIGAAGVLATVVAAILLWRDVRTGAARHPRRLPDTKEDG